MKRVFIIIALTLSACGSVDTQRQNPRVVVAETTLPPAKSFSARAGTPTTRSNADLTRDFLDLAFELESGRKLPRLTRFEQPITVAVKGTTTPSMNEDLRQLLARLRSEAKIDIQQIAGGTANITIHAITRKSIRRALPNAACFVVPNVDSLAQYRRVRNSGQSDWASLQKREKLAIFLPYDVSPQEVRDCLHEELAQAIGPLNDLYRLDDSVFNDDNFHPVLTGFDMLMLRLYYDPSLRNGISRKDATPLVRAALARINPAGERRPNRSRSATPLQWKVLMTATLGGGLNPNQRIKSAAQALGIAIENGWNDHRRGFNHFALARVLHGLEPGRAKLQYEQALRFFTTSTPNGPHAAFAQVELAGFALAAGRPTQALELLQKAEASAIKHQNAAQLASVLLFKSEAYALLGQTERAAAARLDSLGWARYGFGPDWAVRARITEIATVTANKKGQTP